MGTIGSSPIDSHLTRLAIQRGVSQSFVYPMIPAIAHSSEDGVYESWDAGLWTGDNSAPDSEEGIRPVDGTYESFSFGVTPVTFQMAEYYASIKFDWRESHNSVGMRIFEKALGGVGMRHSINRERALHSVMFGTGNWTNVVVGAANRFDNASSNPPGYIRQRWSAIELSAAATAGGARRVIVMTAGIFDQLAQHPVYTSINANSEVTGYATHATIAASFGVLPADLIVARAAYNEQRRNETAAYARIWSENYIWMGYMPTNVNDSTQTALAFIHMNGYGPGSVVRRGTFVNEQAEGRFMRELSIGVYQPVDTAAAALLTSVIS